MAEVKEMDKMNLGQDHERRITILEFTISDISMKMDSVEKTVKEANSEQKQMLTTINNRMVDEFFHRKRVNLSNAWKVVITLLGGGSFLYLVVDLLSKLTLRG